MKSLKNIQRTPKGVPITSDEVLETHAARLILLLAICGTVDKTTKLPRIEGLTKLAKLDFFVRYPSFFSKATKQAQKTKETIESKMIRHHYGPWDPRYYQVIPYLEGRGIVRVTQVGNQYQFILTDLGKQLSTQLRSHASFQDICSHMVTVKKTLGSLSGTALKELIYQRFDEEVAKKHRGEEIV